jgi:hypothetical protein
VESGAYGKSVLADQCASWLLLLGTKAEREPLVVCRLSVSLLLYSTDVLFYYIYCCLLYSFGCLIDWLTPC